MESVPFLLLCNVCILGSELSLFFLCEQPEAESTVSDLWSACVDNLWFTLFLQTDLWLYISECVWLCCCVGSLGFSQLSLIWLTGLCGWENPLWESLCPYHLIKSTTAAF